MMECGLAASPGIAVGKAFKYKNEISFADTFIETEQIEMELERLNQGIDGAKAELMSQLPDIEDVDRIQREILKAHSQIIDDPALKKMAIEKIKNNRMNAPTALKYTIQHLEEIFSGMSAAYMQQRATDIKDIGRRILKKLLAIEDEQCALREPCVIFARDLMPSDILRLDKTNILGFVTEVGGVTSHTAIIARSAGIPAVTGVQDICARLHSGDEVIVDGDSGNVIINPDKITVNEYFEKQKNFRQQLEVSKEMKDVPAVDKKGKRIILGANIGGVDDITPALANGAEKIGLFRTEFIFMAKNSLPGEEEQYGIYKAVIDGMEGRPVVIRTLDAGGDKNIPYLRIQKEDNPFLGLRGIRYCLINKDIFSAQLKAILRASGTSEVTILLPMVSCVAEVVKARELIDELKLELRAGGLPVGENIKVGIMVEVPSAALTIEGLAEVADYFSIGTNDLSQYVLAIDRTNKSLESLYDPGHPALLRLIRTIVEEAHAKGKKVGVCGEMAGNTQFTDFFIETGIDELSMNAMSIPEVKRKIISHE